MSIRHTVRLFLVDDHPIVRSGVRKDLATRRNFTIVGESGDGKEAFSRIRTNNIDVVLLDISLPRLNGLELARRLLQKQPRIGIIVFTMHEEREYVIQFAKLGVKGYMLKDASAEDLIRAIESVHRGGTYYCQFASDVLVEQVSKGAKGRNVRGDSDLTARETEILTLIAEGQSNRVIGDKLDISFRTVQTHRERIMKKLKLHSVVELTKYAIQKGLVKNPGIS